MKQMHEYVCLQYIPGPLYSNKHTTKGSYYHVPLPA